MHYQKIQPSCSLAFYQTDYKKLQSCYAATKKKNLQQCTLMLFKWTFETK